MQLVYEIHYLTETDDIQFAQSGECKSVAEALNRAWYFLGFSNAPGLHLFVYQESQIDMNNLRGGEPLATLRPLAKGSTAEREKGRDGTLADWIDMFREKETTPPTPLCPPGQSYADEGITDDDIPF